MERYFQESCLKNMTILEDLTGKIFHETYPEFQALWETDNERNIKLLKRLLDKEIDRLRSDNT